MSRRVRISQAVTGGGLQRQRPMPSLDYWLLGAAVALLGLGLIMVASASLHLAERNIGSPFFYVVRHLIAIALALGGAAVAAAVPVRRWRTLGTPLYFLGLVLLALVLVPGLGREVNGAVRWIPVGPFSLQSSELMKLFMVVYIAGYLVRRQDEISRSVWGFVKPMLLLVVAAILILLEPDFGTVAVMFATALGMLFLGGVPLWQFGVLLGIATVALSALVLYSPYRLERITAFLDPWADPFNSGFQLTQALIAFGRGEWTGVGLGNGIQKQFYLPEAHTDFLLAIVGEEFGLLGTLTVVVLFSLLIFRAFQIGVLSERQGQRFGAYLSYGCGLLLGIQALINMAVNLGLLPTKGLTLPFMSYGGNSIIVACVIVAILLRTDYELRSVALRHDRKGAAWASV